MHFYEFLECMHEYHMHALCIQKSEENTEYPGIVVTGGCKSPYKCCELNPGLLQEQ